MAISLSEFRDMGNHRQLDYIAKTSGFTDASFHERLNKFNRFRIKTPGNELENMNYFIFFTKPDCNLFQEGSNGSVVNETIRNCYYFNDACRHYPELFKNLQLNHGYNDFITPLFNRCESFSINDRVIKTRDSVETSNDWKTVYGHRMNDSLGAGTFDATFSDTRDQMIYHTIEIWILYIDMITKGFIKPTDKNRDDKILDYGGSVFFFVTAEDGKTILYYRKYVGVFPINIPDNIYGFGGPGQNKKMEYDIQFQYSAIDTSPAVITDFNLINKYYTSETPLDYFDSDMPDYTYCTGCYITESNDKKHWRLNWIE